MHANPCHHTFPQRRALALLFLTAASFLPSCNTVSETGRQRLLFFNEKEMQNMAVAAYAEETGKHKTITGTPQAAMVQRIGQRIAKVSGQDYQWEFKLLDAPDVVNAFALPGGKIAVYTGLLKVATDEDSLAAVIGHEVAHATKQHGNERLSNQMIVNGLATAAAFVLSDNDDDQKKNERNAMILGAFGLGSNLGMLHYSRAHESEADEIGLRYLIMAGYNPEAAPALWERMAKLSGDQPQGFLEGFLSTHPDPLERAKALREMIPRLKAELLAPPAGKK
jgi:predicted Zn-dependent protease